MGIIESLEMHQFMCHKYLTFSLGPQINFIIGEWVLLVSASLSLNIAPLGHNGSKCCSAGTFATPHMLVRR